MLLVGCLADGVLLADCLAAPGGLHAHPSQSLPQLHASLLQHSCWWCVLFNPLCHLRKRDLKPYT